MDADANWTQERRFLAENGLALLEHNFAKSLVGVKRGVWVAQGPCWVPNCVRYSTKGVQKITKNVIL